MNQLGVEWGVAARVLPGQMESGDVSIVLRREEGALIAVVDGVGHGDEAAQASRAVLDILEGEPDEHILSLTRHCHEALRGKRGAVMSIASYHARDRLVTWLGVGNVEGALLRADPRLPSEGLLLRAGVLGSVLPPLQAAVLPVSANDLLILTTDGVSSGFEGAVVRSAPPQKIADCILMRHSKNTDDALVLVARFVKDRP